MKKMYQYIVSLGSSESTTLNVTSLYRRKAYSFRVGSVDASEKMSNWSQSVSLAMQSLLWFCNYKIMMNIFSV